MKKYTKKELYKKIEYYSEEITRKKPNWDTIFRIYYDSLRLINKILYNISENPWHPDNDYAETIFEDIEESLTKLEEIRLKSIGNDE